MPPHPHSDADWTALQTVAREGEPDRAAAALLAPEPLAQDLLVLAAFAAELARIPGLVREPMMGEIRLQWWHDAVATAPRGTPTGNPIADAVTRMIRERGLGSTPFDRMIQARLHDIGRELHSDDAALFGYLDATEGTCFEVALILADVAPGAGRATAAQAAGRAYGLARSLGRLPYHLARGSFPIPECRLAAHGVAVDSLTVRPVPSPLACGIGRAADALRAVAKAELATARTAVMTLDPAARVALLPVAMVEPYFAAQKREQVQTLEQLVDVTPLGRLWRLWRAHRSGRL